MKQHGPWQIIRSHDVYTDPWARVRKDDVIRPDGQPGTYTVVGSRPGYRDVRRTLTVLPGSGLAAALDIRCEEPV